MFTQKDIARAYISGDKSYTSSTTVDGMAVGEIMVQKIDGSTLATGGSITTQFRFVTMYVDGPVTSDWITPGTVTYHTRAHGVPAEQISFIGYNGSAGDMDALASTDYIARLYIRDNLSALGNKQMVKFGAYKSNSTTSDEAVALGVKQSLVANFKREKNQLIKIEEVASGTIAALTGASVIYRLTKGSKTVHTYIKTAGITSEFTASTATVTDGTYFSAPSTGSRTFTFDAVALGSGVGRHAVYIGETAYNVADAGTNAENAAAIVVAINAGVQATSAVSATATVTITLNEGVSANVMVVSTDDDSTAYDALAVTNASGDTVNVVNKIDGTTASAATFTLEDAWVGETCYTYEGSALTKNCGILATSGSYGIKLSGLSNKFVAGTFKYMKTRFDVMLDGFETAEVTNSVLATEGVGSASEVQELEWFLSGNNTDGLILGTPPTPRVTYTDPLLTYQYTTVDFSDNSKKGIQGTPESGKQIIIAFENGCSQAATINTMLGTI
jgi:hypothetical protein